MNVKQPKYKNTASVIMEPPLMFLRPFLIITC